MRHAAVIAVALLGIGSRVPLSAPPAGYVVRSSFDLAPPDDRMRGTLELLEDARIRDDMREPIRQAWGGDPCAAPSTALLRPLCDQLEPTPLRPAIVQLLDARGHEIATDTLPRPIGEVARARLYQSTRRTYLVTVDLSAGIGSYSGPLTRLAEPNTHGFGWLLATDARGGSTDTISLVSTLKTGWRQRPRLDGAGNDLLMVACRPDLDANAFVLTFTRFTYTRDHWVRLRRSQPGCWEADGAGSFPSRADFP